MPVELLGWIQGDDVGGGCRGTSLDWTVSRTRLRASHYPLGNGGTRGLLKQERSILSFVFCKELSGTAEE